MATLKESILLLRSLPNRWQASWSSGEFNPIRELSCLAGIRADLDRKVGGRRGPLSLDGDQFENALALWKAHADAAALPGWALRNLCNHPTTAMDGRFLASLEVHPKLPRRRAWAEGLIAIHFLHWEIVPELEDRVSALKRILITFSPQSPWLIDLRNNDWEVLGRQAPQCLVNSMGNILNDLDPLLHHWCLNSQQGLGKAVTLSALRNWSNQFRNRRPTTEARPVLEELQHAFSTLLNRVPMGGPFLQTVEDIVLSGWSRSSEEIRELLTKWCLSHQNLGDPRTNTGNWHPIPLARARVLSWMARRDLAFFYDKIVPTASDNQGRKEFWLRYVDKVIDFKIAIGVQDQRKINKGDYGKHEIATLEGSPDLSAFILKFEGNSKGGFVCVEFSRSGHALYVYEAERFEDHIAGMHAITYRATPGPRNLKNQDAYAHRQSHYSNWQEVTRYYLNSRGVSPS